MKNIEKLRSPDTNILLYGNHPGIIQSILDFDFLAGKKKPSVVGIIASGRKYEHYFFGKEDMLIPVFSSVNDIPKSIASTIHVFLNVSSARRALASVKELIGSLPELVGGVIFAENIPEKHAIALYGLAQDQGKFIVGPASVGILLPGILKLGAIGGIDFRQLISSRVFTKGDIAVFSSSGGMTNEIISQLARTGHALSFALHFGGDRFPVIRPKDALLLAEKDEATKTIVYFGELGGLDEYEIAALLETKQITKKVICYIAGTISEYFATPPQFGHAKAMAQTGEETAQAKRKVLRSVGAYVAENFSEFIHTLEEIPRVKQEEISYNISMEELKERKHTLISSSLSQDDHGQTFILGHELLDFAQKHSFAHMVISMFLGHETKSKELEKFADFVLRLVIDHGPYVSGAVNTIVTARAGRDLVSSLTAGLLTIGPRFGGATNQAAQNWLSGVKSGTSVDDFVEEFAAKKQYISGIGHRKYRIDAPDPRVTALLEFTKLLTQKRFTNFALSVQKVTTDKKGNLVLNVDGAIAAVLLDLLSEEEHLSDQQLQQLVDQEFFNALFVLSRSVGLISHFLDQKRLDEGLFRLDESFVTNVKTLRE